MYYNKKKKYNNMKKESKQEMRGTRYEGSLILSSAFLIFKYMPYEFICSYLQCYIYRGIQKFGYKHNINHESFFIYPYQMDTFYFTRLLRNH